MSRGSTATGRDLRSRSLLALPEGWIVYKNRVVYQDIRSPDGLQHQRVREGLRHATVFPYEGFSRSIRQREINPKIDARTGTGSHRAHPTVRGNKTRCSLKTRIEPLEIAGFQGDRSPAAGIRIVFTSRRTLEKDR